MQEDFIHSAPDAVVDLTVSQAILVALCGLGQGRLGLWRMMLYRDMNAARPAVHFR